MIIMCAPDRARPLLGAVEAAADRLLELREDAIGERARRHVDLDVELADLGLEVRVRDRLERTRVDQRRIAGLVGQVQLDLEPEGAPVRIEARLAEHAREHVQARPDLLPVALAVLAREDRGGDLLSHGLTLSSTAHVDPIHLHDVQAVARPPARQEGAGGHLAELPAGRQDRRARPERLRQVHAAADHGRAGHRLPRRRPARPRRHRGPARAGAAARPGQGRARQRRGRRARAARHARPLQRAGRQLLGRDRRRVRAPPGRDRRRRRLEPRHHARDRHGRAAAPARRRRRGDALRRRAPPRGALPPAARRARPAAARRAHEPPRRRVGGLAREAPGGVQGHRRGGDPRPLLPRQRGRLDPRARPRPRPALQGQLHGLARAEAGAARAGGAARERAPAHDRARARVGARVAEGPAHEGARPPQALRGAARRGARA